MEQDFTQKRDMIHRHDVLISPELIQQIVDLTDESEQQMNQFLDNIQAFIDVESIFKEKLLTFYNHLKISFVRLKYNYETALATKKMDAQRKLHQLKKADPDIIKLTYKSEVEGLVFKYREQFVDLLNHYGGMTGRNISHLTTFLESGIDKT